MEGIPMRSAGISTSDRERTGIRDGDFYFVDDEYNPFVRHAPVKTMGSSTTRKTVIRRSTVTWD